MFSNAMKHLSLNEWARELLLSIVFVLSFALLPVHVAYSETPSYQETVQFLKSKIEYDSYSRSSADNFSPVTYKFIEKEHCVFFYFKETRNKEDDFATYRSLYTVDFSKIDPSRNSVGWEGMLVKIHTSNDAKELVVEKVGYSRGEENNTMRFVGGAHCSVGDPVQCVLHTTDSTIWLRPTYNGTSSNAIKTSKALRHLTKMCGGAEELF